MSNCRQIRAQLEGGATRESLDSRDRAHVDSCDRCSATLAEQALVSRSLSMIPAAEVPVGSADRAFRAAISGESRISPMTFWERLVPLATPVAAAAALAGLIAFLVGGPPPLEASDLASSTDLAAIDLVDDDDADTELALADDLFAMGDE